MSDKTLTDADCATILRGPDEPVVDGDIVTIGDPRLKPVGMPVTAAAELLRLARALARDVSESKQTRVLDEIAAERTRQVEKGYTPEHDDEATVGELAQVAGLVALGVPWHHNTLHQSDGIAQHIQDKHPRRHQLIIAAALLVAEVERLDRATRQ